MRIASLAGAASRRSLTDSHCKIAHNELLCVYFIFNSGWIFFFLRSADFLCVENMSVVCNCAGVQLTGNSGNSF